MHKHTDLRVWRYWRTLNLLGNFDPNPDPIVRDNIMFSAFLGDVLNMFEAATGSDRFDQPGSLTFVWKDGREFPYDHHSIIEAVHANYERSDLGFFPCEPGWSFTVCNVMGAQSMLRPRPPPRHRPLGPQPRLAGAARSSEEYLTPDGTYAHIRSNHVGLSWDTGEVPGGHYYGQRHRPLRRHPPCPRAHGPVPSTCGGAARRWPGCRRWSPTARWPWSCRRSPSGTARAPARCRAWNKVIGGANLVGDAGLAAAAIDGVGPPVRHRASAGPSVPSRRAPRPSAGT